MITLNPNSLTGQKLQGILQGVIAPRPICFASTVNQKGDVNLSPFSFFNMFSIQPPVCVFSPSRRLRDNTTKHTLENIIEVPECVINVVTYQMVNQTSLASCEFPAGVNEFHKVGFTMVKSEVVRPPRVGESPVQLECRVKQVISLGDQPGSGNLVVAEVVRIHLSEKIFDLNGIVDPAALDLVARLGGNWYARIGKENLFQVEKPNDKVGMGFDKLPSFILNADWLTGNQKARLANLTEFPDATEALTMLDDRTGGLLKNRATGYEDSLKLEIVSCLNSGHVKKAAGIIVLMQ